MWAFNIALLTTNIQRRLCRIGTLFLLSVSFSLPVFSSAAIDKPASDYVLSIHTSMGTQTEFRQGDVIQFLLNLNQTAHILMLYHDAQGNVLQVFPNRHTTDSIIQAGVLMPIPNQHMPFEFVVQPPYGKETLWVFASEKKIRGHQKTSIDNGLYLLPDGLNLIKQLKNNNVANTHYTLFTRN